MGSPPDEPFRRIDEAQVTAKYTDGVRELTLPKKAATQARRITIQ